MGLFKVSDEKSNESYELIKRIFEQAAPGEDCRLVYGYSMKSGFMSKKIGSFILGLSSDEQTLQILPFDVVEQTPGSLITINRSEITSAKRSMQGATVIESPKLAKKLKVVIPPFTAKGADNTYQLPINQEENEKIFRDFFTTIKK
ncbi:hypothetical protein [Xylocopilactobacillus apicola]|uniref:Uncharacterized protein n=1 Tax=Xylocopilactobacillus apicola TaxID=2932184 RepID=A0AAU9DI79_9LACO|nr:hypothetical protein [Xylocopilactobacillus apicola]BDR58051.1 hypothetical protein XA3_04920 [Xylocopilactobacillus apicola]